MRAARPVGAVRPHPPADAALPPCFEHEDIATANPAAVTPTATARHMLRENSGRMVPPAVNESVAQQAARRGFTQRRQSS
ncbi:hypothetical protein WS69_20870 [Burkholderia sp. BDU5]|nr:hypothetical protein WS69_20870 [Burkholderia sp. BDU5]